MKRCNILRPLFVYLFIYYGIKIGISAESGTSSLNKDLLKVVTLDDDGALSENDSSKYDFELTGLLKNQPEYNFKPDVQCVGVKYNNEDVWVYDSSKNQKFPTTVKMDPVAQTLWVRLDAFEFYTFQFNGTKWKFNDQVSLGSCRTYDESLSLSNLAKSFKLSQDTTADEKSKQPETPSDVKPDEAKPREESQTEDKTPTSTDSAGQEKSKPEDGTAPSSSQEDSKKSDKTIFLDIRDKKSTEQVDYSRDEEKNVETFKGKNGYRFIVIKRGDFILWQLRDSRTSDFVEIDYSVPRKLIVTSNLSSDQFFSIVDDPEAAVEYVDLDLTYKESTDQYEYWSSGTAHTYSAKQGIKFKKVSKGTNKLLQFEESKEAVKVELEEGNLGNLLVSVYTKFNRSFDLYIFEDLDVTKTLLTPTDLESSCNVSRMLDRKGVLNNVLRHLAMNDTPSVKRTSFNMDLENLYIHKFKPGSKCKKLTCAGQEVWVSESNEFFPTSLILNTERTFLMIERQPLPNLTFLYYNEKWNLLLLETIKEEINEDEFKFLKTDESSLLVNLEDYEYEKEEVQQIINFKFRKGTKCKEVRYEDQEIWKHQEEHENHYPTMVSINLENTLLSINSENNYRHSYSYYHGEWHQVCSYKSETHKIYSSKLKIITQNEDGTYKTNDLSEYNVEESDSVYVFEFKKEAKCQEVSYEAQTLWKHNQKEHAEDYPNKVTLNTTKKVLIVESFPEYRYVYGYYGGEWKELPLGFKSQKTHSEESEDVLAVQLLKLFTKNEDETNAENDASKYESELSESVNIFKFKEQTKCVEVKYAGKSVWKHDENVHGTSYPKSLIMNKNNKLIMVDSTGYQYFYSYYGEKWNQISGHNK